MLDRLEGKKVAILCADGFEKIELTLPMQALKAEGADVDIVSLSSGKIRGMNVSKPASTIPVDKTLNEVSPDDYDALFIPGGHINPDLLRQSRLAREFVRSFDEAKKPIASLCHSPWVLASSEILGGRTLTSWPGIRDDLVHAGATWLNQKVVSDDNLVTSRGPQDLPFFIPAMIELFATGEVSEQMNTQREESDPQADEPPFIVQKTVNLLSNFPYKYLAIAGAFGLGAYGVMKGKGGFGEHRV